MKVVLRPKQPLPYRDTPWWSWVNRRWLRKGLPTVPSLAFTNSLPFPTARSVGIDGSVTLWDGQKKTVPSGVTEADGTLVFFSTAGIGPFSKILITIQVTSSSGTSEFSMFWKTAVDFDTILNPSHDFWTGISTANNTQEVFTYWSNNEGDRFAIGGTPVSNASEFMLTAPFLAFGVKNTGAQDLVYEYAAFCQRV